MPESSLPNDSSERALSLDLQRLWEVGAYDMPNLSGMHADASYQLHKTTETEGGLFVTPGSGVDGSVNGDLASEWMAARDALQTLMVNSANNYRDTGEAIVKAAEDYAATDDRYAEELDRETERLKGDDDHGTLPSPRDPVSPDDPDHSSTQPSPTLGGPDVPV